MNAAQFSADRKRFQLMVDKKVDGERGKVRVKLAKSEQRSDVGYSKMMKLNENYENNCT